MAGGEGEGGTATATGGAAGAGKGVPTSGKAFSSRSSAKTSETPCLPALPLLHKSLQIPFGSDFLSVSKSGRPGRAEQSFWGRGGRAQAGKWVVIGCPQIALFSKLFQPPPL